MAPLKNKVLITKWVKDNYSEDPFRSRDTLVTAIMSWSCPGRTKYLKWYKSYKLEQLYGEKAAGTLRDL